MSKEVLLFVFLLALPCIIIASPAYVENDANALWMRSDLGLVVLNTRVQRWLDQSPNRYEAKGRLSNTGSNPGYPTFPSTDYFGLRPSISFNSNPAIPQYVEFLNNLRDQYIEINQTEALQNNFNGLTVIAMVIARPFQNNSTGNGWIFDQGKWEPEGYGLGWFHSGDYNWYVGYRAQSFNKIRSPQVYPIEPQYGSSPVVVTGSLAFSNTSSFYINGRRIQQINTNLTNYVIDRVSPSECSPFPSPANPINCECNKPEPKFYNISVCNDTSSVSIILYPMRIGAMSKTNDDPPNNKTFPSTERFYGSIAEVIIFKRALNQSSFEKIYNYLLMKYGLPPQYSGLTKFSNSGDVTVYDPTVQYPTCPAGVIRDSKMVLQQKSGMSSVSTTRPKNYTISDGCYLIGNAPFLQNLESVFWAANDRNLSDLAVAWQFQVTPKNSGSRLKEVILEIFLPLSRFPSIISNESIFVAVTQKNSSASAETTIFSQVTGDPSGLPFVIAQYPFDPQGYLKAVLSVSQGTTLRIETRSATFGNPTSTPTPTATNTPRPTAVGPTPTNVFPTTLPPSPTPELTAGVVPPCANGLYGPPSCTCLTIRPGLGAECQNGVWIWTLDTGGDIIIKNNNSFVVNDCPEKSDITVVLNKPLPDNSPLFQLNKNCTPVTVTVNTQFGEDGCDYSVTIDDSNPSLSQYLLTSSCDKKLSNGLIALIVVLVVVVVGFVVIFPIVRRRMIMRTIANTHQSTRTEMDDVTNGNIDDIQSSEDED